jgi:hypothetical protein
MASLGVGGTRIQSARVDDRIAPGALSWGVVHDFTPRQAPPLRAAAHHNGHVYTSTFTATERVVQRWDAATGESSPFYRPDAAVNLLAIIDPPPGAPSPAPALWLAYADGRILILDLETGDPVGGASRALFQAHKEVKCIKQVPGGARTVITGGSDFQVKTWSALGEPIATSAHHHRSVDALAVYQEHTPEGIPSDVYRVFSGGADGALWGWTEDPLQPGRVAVEGAAGGTSTQLPTSKVNKRDLIEPVF